MTPKTRRRVFLSALVLAFALPAEVVMLRVLATPSQQDAVQQWVGDLDAAELARAAADIQAYPFAYRKEIMRALTPEERSQVWRNHIRKYVSDHPELGSDAREVLRAAEAVASPDVFSGNPDESLTRAVQAVGEQALTVLGRDAAGYVLVYLGDVDVRSASAEPILMRVENWLRGTFVALARQQTCFCTPSWGCQAFEYCSEAQFCFVLEPWPACGWLLRESCTGLCAAN